MYVRVCVYLCTSWMAIISLWIRNKLFEVFGRWWGSRKTYKGNISERTYVYICISKYVYIYRHMAVFSSFYNHYIYYLSNQEALANCCLFLMRKSKLQMLQRKELKEWQAFSVRRQSAQPVLPRQLAGCSVPLVCKLATLLNLVTAALARIFQNTIHMPPEQPPAPVNTQSLA